MNLRQSCRKMSWKHSLKLQKMVFPRFYISNISWGAYPRTPPPRNAVTNSHGSALFSPHNMNLLPTVLCTCTCSCPFLCMLSHLLSPWRSQPLFISLLCNCFVRQTHSKSLRSTLLHCYINCRRCRQGHYYYWDYACKSDLRILIAFEKWRIKFREILPSVQALSASYYCFVDWGLV